MDLLQKELEKKKRALEERRANSNAVSKKYRRVADVRRWEENQQDLQQQSETKQKQHPPSSNDHNQEHEQNQASINEPSTQQMEVPSELLELDQNTITHRLRELGEPVHLFGECNTISRLERLYKALQYQKEALANIGEREEFNLEKGATTRNVFLDQDALYNRETPAQTATHKAKANGDDDDKHDDDDDDEPKDPYDRIRKYFKRALHQWEEDLAQRPEAVRKSVAGRKEINTMKQCQDHIKPLFKQCRRKTLEDSILKNINKIIDYCEDNEFVKAHDAYLDIAIGRAPWPIGVTAVGIHARTGRSKIESQNVAHVMNSELHRKYLTSVKRLITYIQSKRDDVLHSKKVINY